MSSPNLNFDATALEAMVGGLSALDIPHISVQNREDGRQFAAAYGYDVEKEEDLQRLWTYHRKAVTYIQEELLKPDESIPSKLSDPKELGDITNILIIASTRDTELQRWACGILKVMHVFVHLENDLFAQYSNEIQDQILKPIQTHIHEDSVIGTTLGPALGPKSILIKKFESKTFKTTTSSVTKLLAKSELIAFGLLDKVGVRIVTKHLFDVFRVLKYFLEHNLVSFPHNIADQSNNTIYPLNLFLETMESLSRQGEYSSEDIDRLLYKRLEENKGRAVYNEKYNSFSSHEYKFVKFITRRLVRLNVKTHDDKSQGLTFFYPYEVQVVDYETHLKNITGPASHEQYKERQVRRARARIIGTAEAK